MHRSPVSPPGTFTTCYGCGKDNKRGLGLQFHREGDAVTADWIPAPEHGGYGRILHGGVTATLLDEAFGWALFSIAGKLGLTTEMKITLSGTLECGKPLTVRGTIESDNGRFGVVRAEILDAQGKLAATGLGTMRYVSKRAIERMGGFTTG